ncbi:unnamed protein product, partial [Scytosiphon promiscuus]
WRTAKRGLSESFARRRSAEPHGSGRCLGRLVVLEFFSVVVLLISTATDYEYPRRLGVGLIGSLPRFLFSPCPDTGDFFYGFLVFTTFVQPNCGLLATVRPCFGTGSRICADKQSPSTIIQ